MISMFGDPQVPEEVGVLFGATAGDIRARANESEQAEQQGERATAEPSYTDELIHQMRSSISRRLQQIEQKLSNTGAKVEINFAPVNLPVSEETQYGADMGIRITIKTPEVTLVKGMLLQCKRMYGALPKATFNELRGRGEQQAKDMLRVTPASFFMLFNSGGQRDLLNLTSIPVGTICPMDGSSPIATGKRARIGSSCPVWEASAGSIWDLGIAIIPAARVLALSAAAKSRGTLFPTSADIILRGGLPFGVFMVDLFASCFVGDVREEVVRIVTPPKLRDSMFPLTGLTDNEFDGFAIRHYIDIEITVGQRG